MTKKDLQSLLDYILYISKIIKLAHGFLNRMLQTPSIDTSFRQDLAWFRHFVNNFNGTTSFSNWSDPSSVKVFIEDNFCSVPLALLVLELNSIVGFKMIHVP